MENELKFLRTFEFMSRKFFDLFAVFVRDKYKIEVDYELFKEYYGTKVLSLSEIPKNVLEEPLLLSSISGTLDKKEKKKSVRCTGTGKCIYVTEGKNGTRKCDAGTFTDKFGCPYCRVHLKRKNVEIDVNKGCIMKIDNSSALSVSEYEELLNDLK